MTGCPQPRPQVVGCSSAPAFLPLAGYVPEQHLKHITSSSLESWAVQGTVFSFPIRKKESKWQQVGCVVCFSAALTKAKQVSRKEKEFIRPEQLIVQKFCQKSACKHLNCFQLSNDLIISTERLCMRLSILWFLGDYIRKWSKNARMDNMSQKQQFNLWLHLFGSESRWKSKKNKNESNIHFARNISHLQCPVLRVFMPLG